VTQQAITNLLEVLYPGGLIDDSGLLLMEYLVLFRQLATRHIK